MPNTYHMRNLVFLLLLILALGACKSGDKASKGNKNKKEVELIVQLRKSVDINAVCEAHRDVGLKSRKVLSPQMGTWLMTVMSSNEEMTMGIIKILKADMDIVNAKIYPREAEKKE